MTTDAMGSRAGGNTAPTAMETEEGLQVKECWQPLITAKSNHTANLLTPDFKSVKAISDFLQLES